MVRGSKLQANQNRTTQDSGDQALVGSGQESRPNFPHWLPRDLLGKLQACMAANSPTDSLNHCGSAYHIYLTRRAGNGRRASVLLMQIRRFKKSAPKLNEAHIFPIGRSPGATSPRRCHAFLMLLCVGGFLWGRRDDRFLLLPAQWNVSASQDALSNMAIIEKIGVSPGSLLLFVLY